LSDFSTFQGTMVTVTKASAQDAGAAIYSILGSSVDLYDSQISQSVSNNPGSCIYLDDGLMLIFTSYFTLTPTTTSFYIKNSNLLVYTCEFVKDYSDDYGTWQGDSADIEGGILYLSEINDLEISDSTFEGMDIATKGGAIYIQWLASPSEYPNTMIISG